MKMLREWLPYIFLFFLPTQLGHYFFFDFSSVNGIRVDYLAPAIFLTDCIAIILFSLYKKDLGDLLKKYSKELIIYSIIGSISLFISHAPLLALYKWGKFLEIALLCGLFRRINLTFDRVVKALFISTVIQFLLVLLQLYFQSSLQGIWYLLGERLLSVDSPSIAKITVFGRDFLRPYGTFSHPNSLAGFYLLQYIFLLTITKKVSSKILNITILLSALLVLLTFSKLAIIVGAVLTTAIIVSDYKTTILNYILMILALCVSSFALRVKGDPFSFAKRLELFSYTLSDIENHWILGMGLGNHLYSLANLPSKYSYFFLQPVHSIFLLAIHELGVPLSMFLTWMGLKNINWNNKPLIYCLLAIGLTGLGDHYWITLQQNMMLAGVLIGLLASRDKEQETRKLMAIGPVDFLSLH